MDLFPRSDILTIFTQWVLHPYVLKALIYMGFSHTYSFTLDINTTVSTCLEWVKKMPIGPSGALAALTLSLDYTEPAPFAPLWLSPLV